MKRILMVAAAVTAFAAIGAVPAMASQAAPAQPASALHVVSHEVLSCEVFGGGSLHAANGGYAYAASGAQFSVTSIDGNNIAGIAEPVLGCVNSAAGWPFSDHRFDSLYAGDPVEELVQEGGVGGCMQTDSVHSAVVDGPCVAHDAGTYWVQVGDSARGECPGGASWLVNVGITNHYDPYPFGSAMFVDSNNRIYALSDRPISVDDQWC